MKNIFKKRYSLAETVGLIAAALIGVTAVGYGASLYDSLTQFQPNTTAMSADVNANFKALAAAIDALKAAIGPLIGPPGVQACPDDMVPVGSICVDKYEADVYDAATSGNEADNTLCNADGSDCAGKIFARSAKNQNPADHWSAYQAQYACFNVGKRLLTDAEWMAAAAGTPNTKADCNVASQGGIVATGSHPTCVSKAGAFDMVGNAAEMVTYGIPQIAVRGGAAPASDGLGVNSIYLVTNPLQQVKYRGFRCAQ